MKWFWHLLLFLVVMVGAGGARAQEQWKVTDVHGRTLSSTQFLGKVVVLNFCATYCTPCVWEVPNFVALQNEHWREGLVIVGVGVRQYRSELLPFMKKFYINYHMAPSTDDLLWKYGVLPSGAMPVTVIFDREGKQVGTWKYFHTKTFYKNQIIPLLKRP